MTISPDQLDALAEAFDRGFEAVDYEALKDPVGDAIDLYCTGPRGEWVLPIHRSAVISAVASFIAKRLSEVTR